MLQPSTNTLLSGETWVVVVAECLLLLEFFLEVEQELKEPRQDRSKHELHYNTIVKAFFYRNVFELANENDLDSFSHLGEFSLNSLRYQYRPVDSHLHEVTFGGMTAKAGS